MPTPNEPALGAAACEGSTAGSGLWSGVVTTLESTESAPEAAAGADSARGDLGGVTLGMESRRGGLLKLVGWLDLRLITNENG